MKSLIITIILLLTGITKVYSQHLPPINSTEQDTVRFMEMFQDNKELYIGKDISSVINRFQEYKVPIRYYYFGTTSPWIDPKAEIYVNEILISYLDDYTISMEDNSYVLIIDLKPPYTNYTFVEAIIDRAEEQGSPIEPILNAIGKNWIIKDISFTTLDVDIP